MIKLDEKDLKQIQEVTQKKSAIMNDFIRVCRNIDLDEKTWWDTVSKKYKTTPGEEYRVETKEDGIFLVQVEKKK